MRFAIVDALVALGISLTRSVSLLPPDVTVDECCCTAETIEQSNAAVRSTLHELVQTPFFRFFKLNLYADCPFWAVDQLCGLGGGCSVCECDANEVPTRFRDGRPLASKDSSVISSSEVATHDVSSQGGGFAQWRDDDRQMWIVQDGPESELSYVQLPLHPEANTGYKDGTVWKAIYMENCFQGPVDDMCFEQRVLYRLLSGLHTSINLHVARNFHKPAADDDANAAWQTNQQMFDATVARNPERLSNLYFSFAFVSRALSKAADFLRAYDFSTGNNAAADERTTALVQQLLESPVMCRASFDESGLFAGHDKDALKLEIQSYFLNISRLMDCVSCTKCKMWGKLEMLGLGTAFKLLVESDPARLDRLVRSLQQNEIVALVNTLNQLSDSIAYAEELAATSTVVQEQRRSVELVQQQLDGAAARERQDEQDRDRDRERERERQQQRQQKQQQQLQQDRDREHEALIARARDLFTRHPASLALLGTLLSGYLLVAVMVAHGRGQPTEAARRKSD